MKNQRSGWRETADAGSSRVLKKVFFFLLHRFFYFFDAPLIIGSVMFLFFYLIFLSLRGSEDGVTNGGRINLRECSRPPLIRLRLPFLGLYLLLATATLRRVGCGFGCIRKSVRKLCAHVEQNKTRNGSNEPNGTWSKSPKSITSFFYCSLKRASWINKDRADLRGAGASYWSLQSYAFGGTVSCFLVLILPRFFPGLSLFWPFFLRFLLFFWLISLFHLSVLDDHYIS